MTKRRSHLDSNTRVPIKRGPAKAGPIVFAPPGVNQVGPDFDPVQVIYDQNVHPRPNALDILFKTSKGSMPVVSLWKLVSGKPDLDMVPEHLVATQFGVLAGVRTDHLFIFEDLEQTSFYWFRITAGNDEDRVKIGNPPPAEYVDTAGTLQRDIAIYYDRLDILATGGDGGGDSYGFNCAAYEVGRFESPLLPASVGFFANDDVDSGESLENFLGGPYTVERVGMRIAIYAMAGGSSFGHAYLFEPPPSLPDTPTREQNDYSAVANAWTDAFSLPETMGTQMVFPPWSVNTGLFACSFNFMGRVEVTVSDPLGALKQWPRDPIPIQLPPPGILPAVLGGMPHRIVIDGRRVGFRLSPLGEVYLGLGRIDREDWRSLGESGVDALLGAADGSKAPGGKIGFTLVARHQDGNLVAGHLADIESGSPKWTKLGLKTKETPKLVRRHDGTVAVFALDESGHLHHGDLKHGALVRGWKKHGGPFAGPIAAAEDDDRHLFVAVHEAKGDDLCYRYLRDGHKWHRGDAPVKSVLSAQAGKHDKMTIYGMDKKRRVHAHVVGKHGWKNLGTPEEIIAAMQGGKKKKLAKATIRAARKREKAVGANSR
jgi:hypothetical protein